MEQPPGFLDSQNPNYVYLLKKSLYGLKQSLRAWFDNLARYLFNMGFLCSPTDSSFFVYKNKDYTTLLLIYVDDVSITSYNTNFATQIISYLSTKFALKDLVQLYYFLGLEIKYFEGVLYHISNIQITNDTCVFNGYSSFGQSK